MHILHVLDHSLPLQSGYTFRTISILREQRALGWKTSHLTSPKQGRRDAPFETVDGWSVYRTPMPSGLLSRLPAAFELELMRVTARRIRELVDRERPDLIHAHSPALNALPALWVGRQTGLPVVYEVRALWEDGAVEHGMDSHNSLRYRLARGLETFALKRVDAITTICEGLRGEILARGLPEDRVTVIPNGVDPEDFSSGGAGGTAIRAHLGLEKATILGYIGSFYGYEGLNTLIDALPIILREAPAVRLIFVGGGPMEEALKQQAAGLGVTDKIVFAGRVPHAEVQRYYDAIDLLVYPRLNGRLTDLVTPMKPLEAMAMEKLFVASDVGGHRELMPETDPAQRFRAGDAADLARSVLNLLREPGRWPELRRRGRDYVIRERNWSGSVARYKDVYASCIARNRRGRA